MFDHGVVEFYGVFANEFFGDGVFVGTKAKFNGFIFTVDANEKIARFVRMPIFNFIMRGKDCFFDIFFLFSRDPFTHSL